MQTEKYFHKCGYPVLEVKRPRGLAVDIFFLDGNAPIKQGEDGKQNPNVIQRCPQCGDSSRLKDFFPASRPKGKKKARHRLYPGQKIAGKRVGGAA